MKKEKHVLVAMDPKLVASLDRLARKDDRSRSSLIRLWLAERVAREKDKPAQEPAEQAS